MMETDEYRERLERLRQDLDVADWSGGEDRARVREEIIALHRELESVIAELTEVKDELRPLVERYKEIFRAPPTTQSAVRIDHLGSSTYRERGWSALAGADYERAVRELEKAIDLDPESNSSTALLAWAYLRMNELDRGREMIERVISRQPDHGIARTCLGYLRMLEGRFAEAIESLAAVVHEGTDSTATLYASLYLGMVYSERDMHRDAQAFFKRALALGPNLTEAYWELGRSYEREGRADMALEAWRTGAANRFSPWGERCGEAADRLEGGSGQPPA